MEILSTSTITGNENIHCYWNDNNKTVVLFITDLENKRELPIENYKPLHYKTNTETKIKKAIKKHINSIGLFTEIEAEQILTDALRTHRQQTKIKIDNEEFQAIFDKVRARALKNIIGNAGNENEDVELIESSFKEYSKLLRTNGYDWFSILDTNMYDYVDNTKNVFKIVINALCALFGYSSRMICINGGSEVGKSELINTIEKLMPEFLNLGNSSPASIRRSEKYAFDKKIVYLGDKGLSGDTQQSKEDFQELYSIFGQLVTDGIFIRKIVVGDEVVLFELISEGLLVLYTEPYTDLKKHQAGDQYSTRTTNVIANPVEDGLSVFLAEDNQNTNKFYGLHKNYIKYILKHPIQLELSQEVLTKIFYAGKESLRTAKYLKGLFKAYCQYLQIGYPNTTDVEKFLEVFNQKLDITGIESMIYEKLYNNLNPTTKESAEKKLYSDNGGVHKDDLLMQSKDRKFKTFFTANQIQTYFKNDFKRNKNLKDTIEQVPQIIKNLYNAGYLETIEWEHKHQKVYYILYNEDMDK